MNVLCALAILAAAPGVTEIPVSILRVDTFRHVRLSAFDVQGRRAWTRDVGDDLTLLSVPSRFVRLAIEWEGADGKANSDQVPIQVGSETVRASGTVYLVGDRPYIRIEYVRRPPPGLRVTLSNQDDSTGMADVNVVNQTSVVWVVESVQVTMLESSDRAFGYVAAAGPGMTLNFPMERGTCALPLPKAKFRRIIRLSSGPDSFVEFEFPFVSQQGPEHVVFPGVVFDRLRLSTRGWGAAFMISSPESGEAIAVCEGSIVAKERVTLRTDGQRLCGVAQGVRECLSVWEGGRDIGDFPPYPPPEPRVKGDRAP